MAKRKTLRPEDLAGRAELRAELGDISYQTLRRREAEPGFPEPVRELEIGEVWDVREVREWATEREKRRRP